MIPVKELLNKIKYSPQENPADYVLFYYDRVEDKLKELKLVEVKGVEEGFLMLVKENKEVNIPLHRIRKVKKKGKVVWER